MPLEKAVNEKSNNFSLAKRSDGAVNTNTLDDLLIDVIMVGPA
jgi:hypothetical protein